MLSYHISLHDVLSTLPDDLLLKSQNGLQPMTTSQDTRPGTPVHPILCTPEDEIPWILSIVLSPTELDREPHSIQNIRPDPRTGTARLPASSHF